MNGFAAVVDCNVFGEGEVEPEKGHHEEENPEVIEMDRSEIILQVVNFSDYIHGYDEPGYPREDGAGDEVGAEDGAVPHRLNGHGEDKGHDRVDGDSDWNHQNGHEGDPLF